MGAASKAAEEQRIAEMNRQESHEPVTQELTLLEMTDTVT
jgi:hypothetical protein